MWLFACSLKSRDTARRDKSQELRAGVGQRRVVGERGEDMSAQLEPVPWSLRFSIWSVLIFKSSSFSVNPSLKLSERCLQTPNGKNPSDFLYHPEARPAKASDSLCSLQLVSLGGCWDTGAGQGLEISFLWVHSFLPPAPSESCFWGSNLYPGLTS